MCDLSAVPIWILGLKAPLKLTPWIIFHPRFFYRIRMNRRCRQNFANPNRWLVVPSSFQRQPSVQLGIRVLNGLYSCQIQVKILVRRKSSWPFKHADQREQTITRSCCKRTVSRLTQLSIRNLTRFSQKQKTMIFLNTNRRFDGMLELRNNLRSLFNDQTLQLRPLRSAQRLGCSRALPPCRPPVCGVSECPCKRTAFGWHLGIFAMIKKSLAANKSRCL